jgi:hypothetical protein
VDGAIWAAVDLRRREKRGLLEDRVRPPQLAVPSIQLRDPFGITGRGAGAPPPSTSACSPQSPQRLRVHTEPIGVPLEYTRSRRRI